MSGPSLPEKIVAIDGALRSVAHAFGGVIALAYYAEPRATHDIDLNVFAPEARVPRVLARLETIGVRVRGTDVERATRDGQVRLWWHETPIDLFFAYDPFHDAARDARRRVPFAGTRIPILAAEHLVVCKVVFDRPKDWVDIDALLADGTRLDAAEVIRWVTRVVGDTDPRFRRVVALLTSG